MDHKFEEAVAHFIRFGLEDYPHTIRWTTDGLNWKTTDNPVGSNIEQACKEIILNIIKDDVRYQRWVKYTSRKCSASSAFDYVASWFGDNNIDYDSNKEVVGVRYVLTLIRPDGGVDYAANTLPFLVKEREEINQLQQLMALDFCIPTYDVYDYETGFHYEKVWVYWNDRGECPEYAPTDELMYTIEKPIQVIHGIMWEGDDTNPAGRFDAHLNPLPYTYTNVRQYLEYVYDKSPDHRVSSLVPELETRYRWWDSNYKK